MTNERDSVAAIIAVISHAPKDRQLPLLRSHLELQLERIEQAEVDFYEFLADCVVLAGQRMQDVRMDFIEQRLSALENPEFNLEDLIFDLVLMLLVEIAIISAPHLAGGIIALVFSQRAIAKEARVFADTVRRFSTQSLDTSLNTVVSKSAHREAVQRLIGHNGTIERLQGEIRVTQQAIDRSRRSLRRRSLISPLSKDQREVVSERLTNELSQNVRLKAELEDKISHARIARLQLLTIERELKSEANKLDNSVEKMIEAMYEREQVANDAWSKWIEDTVSTTQARIAEDSGSAAVGLSTPATAASHDADVLRPIFSTADILGRYLMDLRGEQKTARQQFGELRNFVRYSEDDAFLQSEITRVLVGSSQNTIARMESLSAFHDAIQPSIIEGIEITLWAYYLNSVGGLHIEKNKTVSRVSGDLDIFPDQPSVRDEAGEKEVYYTIDDLVFDQQASGLPTKGKRTYQGDRYIGINIITNYQAHYFFGKFAHYYLRKHSGITPFPYDPDSDERKYLSAYGMDRTWYGMTNHLREKYLKEVKVLVIVAFRHFLESVKDRSALGIFTEEGIRVGEVFDPDFINSAIDTDDEQDRQARLAELTGTLEEMFSASGISQARRFEEGMQFLAVQLAEIEGLILQYGVALSTQGQIDLALYAELNLLRDMIKDRTLELDASIAYLEGLDAGETEFDALIEEQFGERIKVVQNWSPEQAQTQGTPPGWQMLDPVIEPKSGNK